MIVPKPAVQRAAPMLSVAALVLAGNSALAQSVTTQTCTSPQVVPLTGTEPPPKIVVDRPLPDPLASRGVAVIPYCADNMRIAPMFGEGALAVSPRIGHVHVTVDESPWQWADASGTPLILRGLPPGSHKVLIELVDANHRVVDKGSVTFDVPNSAVVVPPTQPRR